MSQHNIKFNRVSIAKNTLITTMLYKQCGSDSDKIESDFYTLNPLVNSLHIPADGEYLIPVNESEEHTEETGLLSWT